MLDGGVCSGCACGAPTTPELLPDLPPPGELGPIAEALEVFVLREGYLVRTTTELQLRDRDGALRAALALVTLDVDVVDEDVFVLDERSTIRWLDGALREHTRVPLRVPCAGLVALDCGRALCNGVLYDLVAGSATASLAGELWGLERAVRIPGQNTIAGTSSWVRIDARGTPRSISTPRRQDFSVALGWPGTLLVDAIGDVFDTSTCGTAPFGDTLPPGCGESMGPLGLGSLSPLRMAAGVGPELYALVEVAPTRRRQLLHVDVSTREILSSTPFDWPFEVRGMAYDPWADRLLVWGGACVVCDLQLFSLEAP
jgi:hypothetical protein